MVKSNDKVMSFSRRRNRKGLSLMELIVVTVVIALTACMAFPVYKIFQQRSKEKRLKKILTDVRAAISGTKSHNSSNDFQEGFRTVARVKGMEEIKGLGLSEEITQNMISAFIALIGNGKGYPATPADIWSQNPKAAFNEPTDEIVFVNGGAPERYVMGNYTGFIELGRPFYRSKPIHPFHDWYETSDFQYVPVVDKTGNNPGTSYSVQGWEANKDYLVGVKDIVSKGAGLALDGSDTDEW